MKWFASLALGMLTASFTQAGVQSPVIRSFSPDGELVCTNLERGSVASVEWSPTVTGPWANTPPGMSAVTADTNGTIQVSLPMGSGAMFFRVLGVAGNPPQLNMALIPAGSFTMGDTFDEGDHNERPTHTVYVSAFHMDKYEVTKALWDEVYNWAVTHGYSFDNNAQGKATSHPAQSMTWYDAVKWCNARSEKENRTPAYYTSAAQTTVYRTSQVNIQNDWVKWTTGYRLPTEAEWEKAARGGASGHRFPWSDSDTIQHGRADYCSSSSSVYDTSPTRGFHPSFNDGVYPYTSPVGYFAVSGYGLYDLAGNVWEWCWDLYSSSYYSSSPGTDPRGPTSGSYRGLRGGSWYGNALCARCPYRLNIGDPVSRDYGIGFRCVVAGASVP